MSSADKMPQVPEGVDPSLSLGSILQYAPIIQQVIKVVEGAIAGGETQIPLIKTDVLGHRVEIGPTPIRVVG